MEYSAYDNSLGEEPAKSTAGGGPADAWSHIARERRERKGENTAIVSFQPKDTHRQLWCPCGSRKPARADRQALPSHRPPPHFVPPQASPPPAPAPSVLLLGALLFPTGLSAVHCFSFLSVKLLSCSGGPAGPSPGRQGPPPPQAVRLPVSHPCLRSIPQGHVTCRQAQGWGSPRGLPLPLSHALPSTKGPDSRFPSVPRYLSGYFQTGPFHQWMAGNRNAESSS